MFKRSPITSSAFETFIFASTFALAFILVLSIFVRIFSGVSFTWNFARLAPAFGIRQGYHLYSPFDKGVVSGHVYGPLAAFAYLPATLFRSPIQAVIFGQILSLCFTFLPVFFMHAHEFRKDSPEKTFHSLGFLFFGYIALIIPSLNYALFHIHADAPALGLGAIACAVLYCQKRTIKLPTLFVVAIFATLSFWAKLPMLPLIFAIALYILFIYGSIYFVRYLLCLSISNILLALFWSSIFNQRNIFFNMVTIPLRGHFNPPVLLSSKIGLTLNQINYLQKECSYLLLFLSLVLFGFCFLNFYKAPKTMKHIFSEHKWLLFVIVALFMIPSAILGVLKFGGDINSFSVVTYFLAMGSSLALVDLMSGLSLLKDQGPLKFTKVLIIMFLLVNAVLLKLYYLGDRFTLPRMHLQNALAYAKIHKGQIYFPGNPLVTLLSEGGYYHFSHGLFDRELAGFRITDKHFREHIPGDIDSIAIYEFESELSRYVLKYLPEFSKETKIKELPGWIVYTKISNSK